MRSVLFTLVLALLPYSALGGIHENGEKAVQVSGVYARIAHAVAGIETYLRSEYKSTGKERLFDLINQAPIEENLKLDLHKLRKYRNKWVHVSDPWDDEVLIDSPEQFGEELEEMAFFAAIVLRRTIYENPWV